MGISIHKRRDQWLRTFCDMQYIESTPDVCWQSSKTIKYLNRLETNFLFPLLFTNSVQQKNKKIFTPIHHKFAWKFFFLSKGFILKWHFYAQKKDEKRIQLLFFVFEFYPLRKVSKDQWVFQIKRKSFSARWRRETVKNYRILRITCHSTRNGN